MDKHPIPVRANPHRAMDPSGKSPSSLKNGIGTWITSGAKNTPANTPSSIVWKGLYNTNTND